MCQGYKATLIHEITKVLMKRGGLSDFDRDFVEADAKAIVEHLQKKELIRNEL